MELLNGKCCSFLHGFHVGGALAVILFLGAPACSSGVVIDFDDDGFAVEEGDCDDLDPDRYPGAMEDCDGIDNDCDGRIDEDDEGGATWEDREGEVQWYRDRDGDGFGDDADSTSACTAPPGYVALNGDCDDGDPSLNPDTLWYADCDGDGFGDEGAPVSSCLAPEGWIREGGDCDDRNAAVHPGVPEVYGDGLDNDCDGRSDADIHVVHEGEPAPEASKPVYHSIGQAIARAKDGDIIAVGPGVWIESILLEGRSLSIIAREGPSRTVLLADSVHAFGSTVVIVDDGNRGPTLIQGFTISGGIGTSLSDEVGCGISYTDRWGGGLCIRYASPVIRHCIIEHNLAAMGGGVHMAFSDAHFENVVIQDNAAEEVLAFGGGLHIFGGQPSFENVVIRRNRINEESFGGGALGGAVYVGDAWPSFHNVLFYGNQAYGEVVAGGALYASGSVVELDHVSIVDNLAWGGDGGGLYLSDADVDITCSIVAFNVASEAETGWNVAFDRVKSSAFASTYSCYFSTESDDGGFSNTAASSSDKIEDPLFVSFGGDLSEPDLHLSIESGCIDIAVEPPPGRNWQGSGDVQLDPDGSPQDAGGYGGPDADSWDLDGDGLHQWWDPRVGYIEGVDDPDDFVAESSSCDD